jgi:hypothetical protein
MKRLLLLFVPVLIAVAGVSTVVGADAPKDRGRELIELKMGHLVLPFKHWKHQKDVNNECYHCHSKKIGQIEGWGKDTAHGICIPCHDLDGKGPVECHQCHMKK